MTKSAKCTNCGERNWTVIWAGVPVCTDCHKMATVIYERNERHLKALLGLLHDRIRVMLVQGKLRPGHEIHPGPDDSEVQATVHSLQQGSGDVQQQGAEPGVDD